LSELHDSGVVSRIQKPVAYLDAKTVQGVFARVLERLASSEREAPWLMGMTSLALARALEIPEALLVRILATFVDDGRIVQRGGYYATLDFVPALTAEQRAFFEPLLGGDSAQRFLPHELGDVVAELRRSRVPGVTQAFDTLVATGVLVKVGDALYTRRQVSEIRAALEGAIRQSGTLTMAGFRDVVGTSRKYAVPLLEWFDATGVTVRSGDVRVLRERAMTRS
jgi:selenocysteine-specific elongation factor